MEHECGGDFLTKKGGRQAGRGRGNSTDSGNSEKRMDRAMLCF